MSSSRSAGSRKKRHTTSNTLDILNSLPNRTADQHERLTQSARPERRLQNVPRAPRKSIWDLPATGSPERHQRPTPRSPPSKGAGRLKSRQTPRRRDIYDETSSPEPSQSPVAETSSAATASRSEADQATPAKTVTFKSPGSNESLESQDRLSPLFEPVWTSTPKRRCTRLRRESEPQSSPSRTPRRSTRSIVDYREDLVYKDLDSGQESAGEDEGHDGNEGANEAQNRNNAEKNGLIGFDLFSDEEDRQDSLSALQLGQTLTQTLEQSPLFESSLVSPRQGNTPEQVPSTNRRSGDHEEAASISQTSNLEPTVVIQNDPGRVPETPLSKQESGRSNPASKPEHEDVDMRMSGAQEEQSDVEMRDGDDAEVIQDAANASLSEEYAESSSPSASSDSSLFVNQDTHAPERPATRSQVSRQSRHSIGGHDLRPRQPDTVPTTTTHHGSVSQECAVPLPSSPRATSNRARSPTLPSQTASQEKSDVPVPSPPHDAPNRPPQPVPHQLSPPRQSPPRRLISVGNREEPNRSLTSRRIRNRRSRIVTDYPNPGGPEPASPEPEIRLPYYESALQIGQRQQYWEVLIREARQIRKGAKLFSKKRFKDILGLVEEQKRWYDGVCHVSMPSISPRDVRQQEKWLDCILREANQILDRVYEESVAEEAVASIFRKRARKLFEGFEAFAVPALIELVFLIFDAYHSNPRRLKGVYNLMECALSRVSIICGRMTSLVKKHYVFTTTRTEYMQRPLQKLIGAAKSGGLRQEIEPNSSDQDNEDRESSDEEMPLFGTQRPWTEAEGQVLMEGLEQHLGPGRYALIMRDFGDHLEGRTIGELREKAEEVHDKFVPHIQDVIRTAEGEEEWRWLLSVRDSRL